MTDRAGLATPMASNIHDANGIATCLRAYERIDCFYFIAAAHDDNLRI